MKKEKVKESEDDTCRFSDLPESIVHEIMSLLPLKDAIRASTLSKKSTSAWNSIPVLNVDNFTFIRPDVLPKFSGNIAKPLALLSNLVPLDLVSCLLRRRAPNVSFQKFRLRISSHAILQKLGQWNSSDPIADEAIQLAIEKGARELSLCFSSRTEFHYSVPNTVFSAHSVRLLDLTGFKANQPNLVLESPLMEELRLRDSSGLEEIQVLSPKLRKAEFVSCKGLRRIEIKSWILESFKQIQKNDKSCLIDIAARETVKSIVLEGSSVIDLSKFTALESLKLNDCKIITCVHVLSDGLKLVQVRGCDNLERIVIESQSLETFEYKIDARKRRECEINLLHCRSLKKLVLVGASITDSRFIDHMARLVLLESLTVRECYLLKNLVIHDHETLKSLVLESCSVDLEVDCRARNLAMFGYEGEVISSPPLVIARDLHAKFTLKFPPKDTHYEPNPAWISPLYGPFKKLRDFLAFYGHCKTVTLAVDQAFIFPAEVREEIVPPFYGMNHLKLQFSWESMPVVDLVDSALWLAPDLQILTLGSIKYGDILIIIKLDYGNTLAMGEEEEETG